MVCLVIVRKQLSAPDAVMLSGSKRGMRREKVFLPKYSGSTHMKLPILYNRDTAKELLLRACVGFFREARCSRTGSVGRASFSPGTDLTNQYIIRGFYIVFRLKNTYSSNYYVS